MTPLSAKELLTKARVQLMIQQPFYATLVMHLDFVEDRAFPTAVTNGKVVRYNPDYIEGLILRRVMGLLAKLAMHVAHFHVTRRKNRSPRRWNAACSLVVNKFIQEAGLQLPVDLVVPKDLEDLAVEQVYNLLPEENDSGEGIDPYGVGAVEDLPASGEGEVHQQEAEIKQLLTQAVDVAKGRGKLPDSIKRLVEGLLQAEVNWGEALARFLGEVDKSDYSFMRPNTRYLHSGFYLPSLYQESLGEVYLVVDTSGSISETELSQFAGEMQEILETFHKGFTVIYVDAAVAGTQEILPGEPLVLDAKGGGGTSFVPAYDWLAEQEATPVCLVYFTDGYCHEFPEEPSFPTLWCIYGRNKDFKPPFGEVIYIKEN